MEEMERERKKMREDMQLEKCEVKYTGKLNSLMYQFDVNQKN